MIIGDSLAVSAKANPVPETKNSIRLKTAGFSGWIFFDTFGDRQRTCRLSINPEQILSFSPGCRRIDLFNIISLRGFIEVFQKSIDSDIG
jgi:hypothetical protein